MAKNEDSHKETCGNDLPTALLAEGRKNFLGEHPFDLNQYPLPQGIIKDQIAIPMQDEIKLAANVF